MIKLFLPCIVTEIEKKAIYPVISSCGKLAAGKFNLSLLCHKDWSNYRIANSCS